MLKTTFYSKRLETVYLYRVIFITDLEQSCGKVTFSQACGHGGGGYGPREYGLGGRVSVGGGGVIILIPPLQRGEEATSAGGIHPTKMLSCFCNVV